MQTGNLQTLVRDQIDFNNVLIQTIDVKVPLLSAFGTQNRKEHSKPQWNDTSNDWINTSDSTTDITSLLNKSESNFNFIHDQVVVAERLGKKNLYWSISNDCEGPILTKKRRCNVEKGNITAKVIQKHIDFKAYSSTTTIRFDSKDIWIELEEVKFDNSSFN